MVGVKILGLAFSPRHGNTEILVKEALRAAEELPDVECSFYSIAGKRIEDCDSDYRCYRMHDPKKPCPSFTDTFDEILPLIDKADGVIYGCPVYWMTVTAQMKAFMDRTMGIEAVGFSWRNKVAGFITVAYDREGGHETTIRDMQNWALMQDMIVVGVGPERPSKGIGGYLGAMALQGFPYPIESSDPDTLRAVRKDEVGMYAARCVGYRTAEMAKVVKLGLEKIDRQELKWPRGAMQLGAE
jgi:multimeric flavodoxin WrbA